MSTQFKRPIVKVLRQLGFEPFNGNNLFLRANDNEKVLYAEKSYGNVTISNIDSELLKFDDEGVFEFEFALMLLAKNIIKLDQFHALQDQYTLQLNLLKQ